MTHNRMTARRLHDQGDGRLYRGLQELAQFLLHLMLRQLKLLRHKAPKIGEQADRQSDNRCALRGFHRASFPAEGYARRTRDKR